MDKILDKLGIYDLWGVLIPGIISWVSIKFLIVYLQINIDINLNDMQNLLVMLVGSYLIGIILNDMGHIASKKVFYKKNKEPLYTYLSSTNDMLRKYEKNIYKKLLKDIMGVTGNIEDEQARYFFNYCYECLSTWQKSTKADTFESLYGMSRSLCCFYTLMGISIISLYSFMKIVNIDILTGRFITVIIVCFLLTIVFFHRTLRLNECRVKVVLRTYVSVQVKKIEDLQIKNYK